MYSLHFLPAARQDMTEIVLYISQELLSPLAAKKLTDEMQKAVEGLTIFPYINAVLQTVKPLKKEYRKLVVKNYVILYWVDSKRKEVTIARVVFARRDYISLLT